MKKLLTILVSCAVLVACDDSQPAAQAPPPSQPQATEKVPAATTPVATTPVVTTTVAKPPAVKTPEKSGAPATGTSSVAKEPDATTPVAIDNTVAPAKPAKPSKRKPAVAKTVEPEPNPVAEPVVVTAPASDVPPELQKYAALAATPKFREFTALAAERHTLQLRASQLRLEMRGVVATDAQQAAVAAVQQQIGKVGDRMDSYVSGKTWSQDELITMDFIVSEQMRLRPPPG